MRFPVLFQLNTRVYLTDQSVTLGRKATLDDIPDAELDYLVDAGFQWLWLLSVWQTGSKAREISRTNPEWLHEFSETLPDLQRDDIGGSGFAINSYDVHTDLGGDEALARLRERLQAKGLKLMLDFVPNHVAPDHSWLAQHPDYFIRGDEDLIKSQPLNYTRLNTTTGCKILAYGRDPYFTGWPDTLQLNYANPALQEAMTTILLKIAAQCDGVRCDMAMLVVPEVFKRTWGMDSDPFWPQAISQVRKLHPAFIFMAEVYWDMEWTLQQVGFDYTYDKRLYDRLLENYARPVREHLMADWNYQVKSVRFLENHDEPRAASVFSHEQHEAAAIISFFIPGLRFFHQGQLQGYKKKISPHLIRGPRENIDATLNAFYKKLLGTLKQEIYHSGNWEQLSPLPVHEANPSYNNFLGFAWSHKHDKVIIVVNYSSAQSQCFLKLPYSDLDGQQWTLQDEFSGVAYKRDGTELRHAGLFLDEPGWKYYTFTLKKC